MFVAGLFASSAFYAEAQQTKSPSSITRSLAAGDKHEDCQLVRAGDSLHYDFTATAALEFNVHHHGSESGNVTYLFGPDDVDSSPENNNHAVTESKIICLLWSNNQSTPVRLNYSMSILGTDE